MLMEIVYVIYQAFKKVFFLIIVTELLWYNVYMKKLVIDDVIVVEGRHDADKVAQVVDALILITHGSSLSKSFLEQLENLAQKKSIIVFTDNDSPGKHIRNTITKRIPTCKHAKIREKQIKVGVEHASESQIRDALTHLITFREYNPVFSFNDLVTLGLNGMPHSAKLRDGVTYSLRLPKMNAKALLKALNHLNITREELEKLCLNQSLLP